MSRFDLRLTKAERALPQKQVMVWAEAGESDAEAMKRYTTTHPEHAASQPRITGWMEPGKTAKGRIAYAPRPQQQTVHDTPARFIVVVMHRRGGKTIGCVNHLVRGAIRCPLHKPRFAYLAPSQVQAKDVAWEPLKHFTAPIAGAVANETELRIDLPNKGRVRLYGADNADRLRGIYLDGIVIDEFAYMHPRVWSEIIRPALADRLGWAIFIGTPLGRNAFCDLYEEARDGFPQPDGSRVKDPDWAALLFKASETGIVPQAELDAARRVMTPDQYAQEFEVSFDAAIPGAYYAQLIADAETEGRIKRFPHELALPVHTGWDLGIADATSIWFAQVVHGEIRLIDYYEASGVGLEHYVGQLRAGHRAHWVYGQHFFPHDLKVKELGSGLSRVDVLRGFGLYPTVLPASSVDDGISLVRFGLRKSWFNSERCADGVKLLRQYRSEWDEKRQVLKPVPLHDFTSHCADAARTLYVGLGKKMLTGGPLHDPRLSSIRATAGNLQKLAKGSGRTDGKKAYGWRS